MMLRVSSGHGTKSRCSPALSSYSLPEEDEGAAVQQCSSSDNICCQSYLDIGSAGGCSYFYSTIGIMRTSAPQIPISRHSSDMCECAFCLLSRVCRWINVLSKIDNVAAICRVTLAILAVSQYLNKCNECSPGDAPQLRSSGPRPCSDV